ncbi:type VI secretion system membrane subunit TssM [Endozoicomonas lisbonensis]|uniref:Type VI secretion system protein ImpL n=1 Tax=Endozoicomonas lisbonensis TaxID=3120522 RepID=A0ABV2SAP3_9GAMM
MKRFLAVLANPWVTGFIGLCALSLVIWFGAGYVRFGADNTVISKNARLMTIVVLFLVWVICRLVLMLRERKQNADLLEGIQADAGGEAHTAPEDARSREELDTLSQRFKEAVTVLKASKFRGGKALYQMPWYIIIGPPGSGKTTALMNSGLQFPVSTGDGKAALGGIGGTRHCDWWFTDDAVLIDTSGRYTTQDSHRIVDNAAWTGFLGLLKKYRRRQPINGAIVAISLQDLMLQTEEQRQQHAKVIRARLDELQQQLGIAFPVYLTFTKTDLIAGFSEFFGNLSQSEREQVWGITLNLPAGQSSSTDLQGFGDDFNALVSRLNDRVLKLLHQERDLERRALLQGFPARISGLQGAIETFLQQVFTANQFQGSPLLRGIYFTSGTQEGTPIDRMMSSVSASFGLPGDAGRQQVNMGKSFFIRRLLKEVIFPESTLVGVNRRFESLLLWGRRAALTLLLGVTGATLAVWAVSVGKNKRLIAEVNDSLDRYQSTSVPADKATKTSELLPSMEALKAAGGVYDQQEHPWLNSLGLYDGDVDRAANRLYDEKLLSQFLPVFQSELEQQLRYPDKNSADTLEKLRVYLMLTTPEHRDNRVISQWAEQHWAQELPGEASRQQALAGHLARLLSLSVPALEPDSQIVKAARQQIRAIPVAQRIYARMKQQPGMTGEVDLFSVVGGDTGKAFGVAPGSDAFVSPRRFTLEAWKQADFSADSPLLTDLEQDQWLYGSTEGEDFSRTDREKIAAQVEKLYLAEYARYWQGFLNQFRVQSFSNLRAATASLEVMADPVYSPLKGVLEAVALNTQLVPPVKLPAPGSAAAETAGKLLADVRKPTTVDQQFQSVNRLVSTRPDQAPAIQEVLASVRELHDFLNEMVLAADSDEQAYAAARARFQRSGNDVIKRLRTRAARMPEPVKGWLISMADSSWGLLLDGSRRYVNTAWQDQVYSAYQNSLQNRYPFADSGDDRREAPWQDFNRFFKPDGVEQQFFNEYLKPFVDTRKWRVKTLDGRGLSLSGNTLTQLRRASLIRQSFYKGSSELNVNFKLQPTRLDSDVRLFSLELGEQRLKYSHGPRIVKQFNWRSADDSRARIIFEDLNDTVNRQEFEGDWAWFRLLDASELLSTSDPREFSLTFNERGRKARFRLIAGSSDNPFDTSLLRNYRLKGSL